MPKIRTGPLGGQYIISRGQKKYLCSMSAEERMNLYRQIKPKNKFGWGPPSPVRKFVSKFGGSWAMEEDYKK